jgi:hypothetical protein
MNQDAQTTIVAQQAPSQELFELPTNSGSIMLAGGAAFEHIQRVAKMFSSSKLVPQQFQGNIADCTIALEMAHRMSASPMAIMQNLYIVHGKPGWSAQFIVACLAQCGRFGPLRFALDGVGDDLSCVAHARELATGETLEGPPVSIQMAKAEGWYGKNGSKWQTMPELMLRYRAATFFGRLYAPDLLMGMQTTEELQDIRDFEPQQAAPPLFPPKANVPAAKTSAAPSVAASSARVAPSGVIDAAPASVGESRTSAPAASSFMMTMAQMRDELAKRCSDSGIVIEDLVRVCVENGLWKDGTKWASLTSPDLTSALAKWDDIVALAAGGAQ